MNMKKTIQNQIQHADKLRNVYNVSTYTYHNVRFNKCQCQKHTTKHKTWTLKNKYHNLKAPAIINYSDNIVVGEYWMIYDQYHRTDGPAVIKRWCDGTIMGESYFINNRKHRENSLPAVITYNKDGNVICEEYYVNDVLHRTDGPAVVTYNEETQQIEWVEWYHNGSKLHSAI